jgi:hypothetical protein
MANPQEITIFVEFSGERGWWVTAVRQIGDPTNDCLKETPRDN